VPFPTKKNVISFTSYINDCLTQLSDQWDSLLSDSPSAEKPSRAGVVFDSLPWFVSSFLSNFIPLLPAVRKSSPLLIPCSSTGFPHFKNFLAFDIIGSLAFGRPFGMLQTGKDAAIVGRSEDGEVLTVEAIKVLNERGEVSATLGCLTPWMRCVPFEPFQGRRP
jgi:hypothetical protein